MPCVGKTPDGCPEGQTMKPPMLGCQPCDEKKQGNGGLGGLWIENLGNIFTGLGVLVGSVTGNGQQQQQTPTYIPPVAPPQNNTPEQSGGKMWLWGGILVVVVVIVVVAVKVAKRKNG